MFIPSAARPVLHCRPGRNLMSDESRGEESWGTITRSSTSSWAITPLVAAKVRQAEAHYMNALRDFGHESAEAYVSKRHLDWLKGLKRRTSQSLSAA